MTGEDRIQSRGQMFLVGRRWWRVLAKAGPTSPKGTVILMIYWFTISRETSTASQSTCEIRIGIKHEYGLSTAIFSVKRPESTNGMPKGIPSLFVVAHFGSASSTLSLGGGVYDSRHSSVLPTAHAWCMMLDAVL